MRWQVGWQVIREGDPRHIGTVERVYDQDVLLIRWANGWLEFINTSDVKRCKLQ